jgi:hypothetical protein
MGKETTKPRATRKWTEAEARAALEEWRRSGESELGFARGRGFSPQRLRYWRDRLGTSAKRESTPPAFVALSMPVVAQATPKIEVHIGAVAVCVREDVDAEHLARLVGALARIRPC